MEYFPGTMCYRGYDVNNQSCVEQIKTGLIHWPAYVKLTNNNMQLLLWRDTVVVYLWSESEPPITKVRLISARRATPTEIRQYEENE